DLYKKSDYNDLAVDLAAGPEFFAGRSRVQLEVGATQRWFGQDPYTRSARAKGTWTLPVDRQSQLRIGASATLTDNLVNDLQDGKRFSGEIAFERALSSTMGASLTLAADRELARRDPGLARNRQDDIHGRRGIWPASCRRSPGAAPRRTQRQIHSPQPWRDPPPVHVWRLRTGHPSSHRTQSQLGRILRLQKDTDRVRRRPPVLTSAIA
ncbi:MAG TPA: hypothetical protein VF470_10320, partial [Sphingomicrobium sp.]